MGFVAHAGSTPLVGGAAGGAAPQSAEQTAPTWSPPEPLDPTLAALYLWDPWPVLDTHGDLANVHGEQWWMVLTAPRDMHPEARHDHARLRMLRRTPGGWQDLGAVFPDDASPGSREWSGTAVFDDATSRLRVLYTATGVRGEEVPSYRQRIFEAYADVSDARIVCWEAHTEVITAASPYLPADQLESAPGVCRAFRDPFLFRDPRDGSQYLLFAASLQDGEQTHAGAVGIAAWQHGAWALQAPVLDASGVNRELERPHLLYHDGLYYLFFSTHGQSFSRTGRTGLYGWCASDLRGPYTPLNGSGLVLGNPVHAPHANYAWQVLSDGTVISFRNYPSAGPGPLSDEAEFMGDIAAFARLRLLGATSSLVPEDNEDNEDSEDNVGATA